MILEFYLAKKILARKQARFFKLISLITILGVAIGVMALLVVIAVMNGFDKELEEKIFGINSGLLIKKDPYIYNEDYSYLGDRLAAVEEIKGYTPIIMGNATIITGDNVINIFLKGVNLKTEVEVTRFGSYLKTQLNSLSDNEIIVGSVLADNLNLKIGSELVVLIPYSLKIYSFKVRGIFESGMYDYDLSLGYINLDTARKIFGINGFTAIEAKVANPYKAEFIKKKLIPYLGGNYYILTWMDLNRNLFQALKLEKTAMFIILCLIVLVASFNISSILIMSVVEKIKDIGILRAIGMRAKDIRKLFIFQGLIIGGLGIFLGAVLGWFLIYILKTYPIVRLPSDIYYIDRLPVASDIKDFIIIVGSAFIITLISTIYPALRASRFDPVVALRYE